jgi:putative flippase GtrA
MEAQKPNSPRTEIALFLLVGAINTAVAYVLYLLFLVFMPYLYAYSVSYGVGVGVSYYLNSRFVFRQPLSLAKFLQFPAVYVIQYCIGAALLWMLVGRASLAPELAMIAVVILTIPVTYLTSRFILKR